VSMGSSPDPRLVLDFRGTIEDAPLALVALQEVALAAELEPTPVKPQEEEEEEEVITAEGRDLEVDEQALDALEEQVEEEVQEEAESEVAAVAEVTEPEPAEEQPTASALGWSTVAAPPQPAPEVATEEVAEPSAEVAAEEVSAEEVIAVEEEALPIEAEVAFVEEASPIDAEVHDAAGPMGTPGTILHPPQKRPTKAWKQLEREHRSALRTFLGPVRQAYVDGLPEGDMLFVKVPFPAGRDRVEYLWLRVDSWNGREIMAELVSLPAWVGQLYPGAMLALIETTVFDYLWRRADETEVGNTTEGLLAVD